MQAWLNSELQQIYKTPLFASTDPHETKLQTVKAFKDHTLRWHASRVDSALHQVDVGALSFFILRYGSAVQIEPGALNGFMLFQVPLTGTAQIRVGKQVVSASPTMGAVISPTLPLQLDWSEGCEQMLVKIPRDRVEETCRTLTGRDLDQGPIEFQPEMALDSLSGRGWQYHLGGLLCHLDLACQSHSRPLIHAQEQTLIHHLLLCQPSNYSERMQRRPAAAPQRKIRAVSAYICANLHEPLGLDEIAQACGIGVRSMTMLFREHYQCSPMAWIRQARLDAARQALLDAGPGDRVTEIALRSGFTHLGRFCASYRSRYGETPMQTLRR